MASIQTLEIAAWISAALGGLIIAGLLLRRENPLTNQIFILWIIQRVFRQFLLVWIQDNPSEQTALLFRLNFPFQILSISLVYIFVRAYTEQDYSSWRKIHLRHFVPFLLSLIWFVWITFFTDQHAHLSTYEESYQWNSVSLVLLIFYTTMVVQKLQAYERHLVTTRSNLGPHRRPILRLVIACCFINLIVGVVDLATGPQLPLWSAYLGVATLSLFLMAAAIMRQSEAFKMESIPEPIVTLTSDEITRMKSQLMEILKDRKSFLNPQLRLKDLADEMGIKSYRLTALLKQGFKTTFYDLINQMRIDHAKGLLSSETQTMNILGIALDSGFNSKSAFNELFKRYNNATPSEFRKKTLKDVGIGQSARPY